jgi:hypothetical protein
MQNCSLNAQIHPPHNPETHNTPSPERNTNDTLVTSCNGNISAISKVDNIPSQAGRVDIRDSAETRITGDYAEINV